MPFRIFKKSELVSHGNGVPPLKVCYQMKDANMKGYELYASNCVEKTVFRGCKGNWCIGRAEVQYLCVIL